MNASGRPLLEAAHGPSRRWWVLGAVECGNFVVYMDAFIVTLALPAMGAQFGVGLHEVKWVMLSYMIALTASLLVAGRLGDRLGGFSILRTTPPCSPPRRSREAPCRIPS